MMKKALYIALLILFLARGNFSANPNTDLKKSKSELDRINANIKQNTNRINKLKKLERQARGRINKYRKDEKLIEGRLGLLRQELDSLAGNLKMLDSCRGDFELKYNLMLHEYERLCTAIYLSGQISDEELIVLNETPNLDLRHQVYFSSLSDKVGHMTDEYRFAMGRIQYDQQYLQTVATQKDSLRHSEESQYRLVHNRVNSETGKLNKIKSDKKSVLNKLSKLKKSASRLKNIIAKLMKQDKSGSTVKPFKGKKLPIGPLNWPVARKDVLRHYGKIKNKETNTYYDNPGIDISAAKGTTVKAAADGEISLVHWLPGYGNLCIIRHGKNFRTVYANLSTIFVKKGQKISKGKALGRTGESVDGQFLHFELWHGDHSMDPYQYLR